MKPPSVGLHRIAKALIVLACFSCANSLYADNIQVTFTGQINLNIDPLDYAFAAGDPYSAVLTYDASQLNQGTSSLGLYGEYSFIVTVQSATGPLVYGGPISWCPSCGDQWLKVYNDVPIIVPYINSIIVDGVGEGTAFSFWIPDYSHTALSSASLADVNWQNLFALSEQSSQSLNVEQPSRAKIALRAPNGADVVEGRIVGLSVQYISSPPAPVPEPSLPVLLGIGITGVLAIGWRRGSMVCRSDSERSLS
jgi:hypothetical protein